MSPNAGVSPADSIKDEVYERIVGLGGIVRGADHDAIRFDLGFDPETLSLRTLRSALWKLTCQERLLRFVPIRDSSACSSRCNPVIVERIYVLA